MITAPGAKRCAGIVSLAAVLAGCTKPSSEPTAAQPPRVTVAHPVERQLIDEDDFNGWLEASETVEVRARVRGHIKKVHFRDGDVVERDQLLFELDPDPFRVAIDETIAQAKAFEAQQVAADKEAARQRDLVQKGASSQRDLERAEASAASYQAQIAAKMQEVERHKLDLKYSRIIAPIPGRISRALLTEGNLVNAGGTDPLLTTIVAQSPIYAYFSVSERALQRYRAQRPEEGQPAPVRELKVPFRFGLDTETGYPHEGTLDFANNKIDRTTGTIQVRGVVDNRQGKFVPGSRVRVRVPVSESYSAIVVPDAAILSDQDKRYLLVVGEKNLVARRDVALGKLLDDGQRVVLPAAADAKGVSPSDVVIVLGLQRARVNYAVEPVPSGDSQVSLK